LYARVSTLRQEQEQSLASQLAALRACAIASACLAAAAVVTRALGGTSSVPASAAGF
jgi:DNA invertase Pin-like site-specific DNA recombinase